MKQLLFAATWVWIAHSPEGGQVSPLYQNLNLAPCTSGYLRAQSEHPLAPHDGTSYAGIDPGEISCQQLSIKEADINPEDGLFLNLNNSQKNPLTSSLPYSLNRR